MERGAVPDQLYLSYWIGGFNEHNMLRAYRKMLELFPYSKLATANSVFGIIPLGYQEPPLVEGAFPAPIDFEAVLHTAHEHVHDDCAYELEAWWDLWQYDQEWKIAPARVSLCCFAPQFDNELGDHLRIEFGQDSRFLPQPDAGGAARMVRSNIRSLLHLAHQLDDSLKPVERRLWSESGENFAGRVEEFLKEFGDTPTR